MNIITVVLLVVALVLFVLCVLGITSPPRFNLLAAGLAFCVLAMLAGTIRAQPQAPADATREERAAQREYLREQGSYRPDAINREDTRYERRRWRQYCREWYARVERHPRLLLPRECRR